MRHRDADVAIRLAMRSMPSPRTPPSTPPEPVVTQCGRCQRVYYSMKKAEACPVDALDRIVDAGATVANAHTLAPTSTIRPLKDSCS